MQEEGRKDGKFTVNCLVQRVGLSPFYCALGIVYGPHITCNKRSLNVSCRTKKNPEEETANGFPFMLRDIGQTFAMLKSEITSGCNTLLHRKPTYSNPKLFGLC